jgi:DNA-binding Lrp family transcriptional regulator
MTELQKTILDIIQARFPIEAQPYAAIARRLNCSQDEIIAALQQLKDSGIIRRIGAIFEAARLGYVSTLVAARVPQNQQDAFVADINTIPGVSHNYGRAHQYNVWFTLTQPNPEIIDQTLAGLRQKFGIDAIYSLPAVKLFKIRVDFDVTGSRDENPDEKAVPGEKATSDEKPAPGEKSASSATAETARLSETQIALVKQLQEDLPIVSQPFDAVAQATGLDVPAVLEQINRWKDNGAIRRFGASVRHQRIGFAYNGMAVFEMEPPRIEDAGRTLAGYKQVSHCYHRPTAPGWPYNLFAMTHCKSEEQLQKIVKQMVEQIKPKSYDVLLSTVEYKKTNVKYFLENSRTT